MFISVHIPKTAGTTFRELLGGYFGNDLCLFYAGLKNSRMEPIDDVPIHAQCIHGHIHARDFDQRFPGAARLTWLRHPVERVVSEFEHYRRHPNPGDELSELAATGGLIDFAHHPQMRNTQVRVLQGLAPAELAFAGISECFDRELERLETVTGIRLPPGHRTNVNPARTTVRYPLDAATRAVLAGLNRDGIEVYKEAVAVARLDPDLAA